MTNLIVPFTRRASFRKLPYEYDQGRGVYSGGLRGGVTATLNLDFTTMTALPSTITFSRPSNATYYDSTGKLTYAPNNQLLYSQDFTNAAWVISGTVTRTSGQTDPSGGTTATKLDLGASSGIYQFAGSKVGNYVFSVWVKGDTAGTIRLSDASGGAFDLNVNVTTTWARVDTGSRAISGFVSPYINRSTGNLATVYVAFSQFELVTYQTTPGTYNATTSAAYYGARLDYNPATLAARGLLIEEARTNLAIQSTFASPWFFSFSTGTLNSATAPDGTLSAVLMNSGTATDVHQCYIAVTGNVSGATATDSVYVKAGTGRYITISVFGASTLTGGYAVFDLVGAAVTQSGALTAGGTLNSTSITAVGNGFYRLTVTATPTADTSVYFAISTSNTATYTPDIAGRNSYTGTSTTYYIWGAQSEAGSFPTSYIPTAGGTVSRSADTASMTGTNFSSWYNATAGAFLVQFDTPASGTRIISAADDNTANNNIQMLTSGTDPTFLVTTSGTAQASIDAGTVAVNTVYKFAGTYSANDFAACISGGTVGTDTSGTIPTVDRLRIGAGQAGNTLCGHIALLNYYPARLTDATLQSLTL